MSRGAAATVWVASLLLSWPASARLPSQAPVLPPPDPSVVTIVEVDTAQELADACWNLTSNQAIVIAPGVYDLGGVDFPNGQDGRLTIGRWGAPPIANVQIRGATGRPQDVLLLGRGMLDETVPFGFQVFTATDVLIADLSVGEVYYHAVAIQHDQGAARVRLYHCRLHDAGQQIVKGNPGAGGVGAPDVVIEYCEVFSTDGVPAHPEVGACYTNGIDAVGGQRWVIRDCLIRDIRCADGSLAGPAILMWQGSADTVVERTIILDSSRGVSLGLVGTIGDHTGGVVRNVMVRWEADAPYERDAAIYVASPDAQIIHNSVLTNGAYQPGSGPVALEVRFAHVTGVRVAGNLLDAAIWLRDGAAATTVDTIQNALPEWFVDAASGDLHLRATATAAMDLVDPDAACADDADGYPRPSRPGGVDVGADEFEVVFGDGFESGGTGWWSSVTPG